MAAIARMMPSLGRACRLVGSDGSVGEITLTWACSMQYHHTVIVYCTMCRSCCSSIRASGTSAIEQRGSNQSRY